MFRAKDCLNAVLVLRNSLLLVYVNAGTLILKAAAVSTINMPKAFLQTRSHYKLRKNICFADYNREKVRIITNKFINLGVSVLVYIAFYSLF